VTDDGRTLRVVEGFRERLLSYRRSGTPRSDWSSDDYLAAARRRVRRGRKRIAALLEVGCDVRSSQVLEIGAGTGVDALLLSMAGVSGVTGVDVSLLLFEKGEKANRYRRLAGAALAEAGFPGSLASALRELPVRFVATDATAMGLPEASVDLAWSRATLEHVKPIEQCFAEMRRVVRPGGFLHHAIDPFFWLRGCHRRAVTEMPWAHVRLSEHEFERFVREAEGEERAREAVEQLGALNRCTRRDYRRLFEAAGFRLTRIVPTRTEVSVIEAEPV
jgi:ubiquinone/menaquinone biosynthesis C-methylase UbiE